MTYVADPLERLDTLANRRLRRLHIAAKEGDEAGGPVKRAKGHGQAELARHLRPLVEEGPRLGEPAAHRFQLGQVATHVAPKHRVILVAAKQPLDPVDRFADRRRALAQGQAHPVVHVDLQPAVACPAGVFDRALP
jgi:hypothetical protein